jgi:hypothetical protein
MPDSIVVGMLCVVAAGVSHVAVDNLRVGLAAKFSELGKERLLALPVLQCD